MKLFLILILTISAFDAFSCECYSTNLDTLIKYADYAFIGEAVKNISPDSQLSNSLDRVGKGTTVEFKVHKTIKGTIADDMIVIDQRTGCINSFKLGSKYLVFGSDQIKTPMTPEQRNQEYLIDEIINGASNEEIKEKVERIEEFFNDLRQKRTYIYTDGCNIYDPKSGQYKKMKKYSR